MNDSIPDFDLGSIDLSGVENPCPPSSNTGGNLVTPPQNPVFDHKSIQKCKIDYLSFTSCESMESLIEMLTFVVKDLVVIQQPRGWMGYRLSAQLQVLGENVGMLAWGASHPRNYVSLSGAGCKRLNDWAIELLREILMRSKARITRIDLALDFYRGELSYEDCEAALSAGEFSLVQGGRKPTVDRHGSEGHYGNKGRTLYVGSTSSSKRICMYEKGLEQFGRLPSSWLENQTSDTVVSHRLDGTDGVVGGGVSVVDWLRAEVRYSDKDRNLDGDDYAIMIDRDRFFAGAYPFCARVIEVADGRRPETMLTETEADIEKQKLNLKNSYGSFVHSLRKLGYTDQQIVDSVDSGSLSRRLVKAGYFTHLDQIVPF